MLMENASSYCFLCCYRFFESTIYQVMTMDNVGATSSSATPPNIYGGLEGPDSMYLKLISSDGHEFVVRRDFAINASPTIKNMLSGPGQYSESQPNEIYLKDIQSHVLINVCRYFAYKAKYTK